jgi:hypothetical protein
LSEQPFTDSQGGGNPSAQQQNYSGDARSSIIGTNQTIAVQASSTEHVYSVSTGYATASASLVYGFVIVGPPDPLFGVAVTFSGSGKTDSRGAVADNSVNMSIVLSDASDTSVLTQVDGDTGPLTLLSQTSIGTVNYTYTLFLEPDVQYEIDMEAEVLTDGVNGLISATLDPNVSTDTPNYDIVFGDGIGNGTGVMTAPEPSTWAMLLLGFAGRRWAKAA